MATPWPLKHNSECGMRQIQPLCVSRVCEHRVGCQADPSPASRQSRDTSQSKPHRHRHSTVQGHSAERIRWARHPSESACPLTVATPQKVKTTNSKKVFYIFLKKQKSNNLFDIRKSNNFLNFFLGTPWLYQTSPSTRATRCCSPFSRI